MEDLMTNNSEIVVFFLMVPVLMQIVLPLLILAGYGIGRMVRVLFKKRTTDVVLLDASHPDAEKLAGHI